MGKRSKNDSESESDQGTSGTESGSNSDASAQQNQDQSLHWWQRPHYDPSAKWRSRHQVVFYALGGATPLIDLSFAVFIGFATFDLPIYIWLPAAAFVGVEGLYIAISVACIYFKKFTTSKFDLGWPLSFLWALSCGGSIAYLWGAYDSSPESMTLLYTGTGLAIASNILSIALGVVAWKYYLLILGLHSRVIANRERRV